MEEILKKLAIANGFEVKHGGNDERCAKLNMIAIVGDAVILVFKKQDRNPKRWQVSLFGIQVQNENLLDLFEPKSEETLRGRRAVTFNPEKISEDTLIKILEFLKTLDARESAVNE